MKVIVIGGVAAGTKVAAKLKREDRSNEVIIFNAGKYISYAGCGLPYYLSNVIEDKEALIVNTPEKFSKLTGVEVKNEHEVISVNPDNKTVEVIDLKTGKQSSHSYDKLVVATGASAFKPDIEGIDLENVFVMRSPDDAVNLREIVDNNDIKKAVIVGGGFIGLEVAENLSKKGVKCVVMDMANHVLPGFDDEMCDFVENHLSNHGIMTLNNTKLVSIIGETKVEKVQTQKRAIKADLVVLAMGIKPNTSFLKDSGIALANNGAIIVDEHLRCNIEDIYSAGDCCMVKSIITNQEAYSPMGSSANIEGRIVAKNINGANLTYRGVLNTAICKLPELNVGRTGLSEQQAIDLGYDVISVVAVCDDKAHYYPGASNFYIKLVGDKSTNQLLGIQVLGSGNVDKMIDITATAITMKAKINDLVDMDLAYAPPFSTAIHPFVTAINILINKINGEFVTMSPKEFNNGDYKDYKIIDTCLVPTITTVPYVDLVKVNGMINGFDFDDKILLICNKGKRAYLLQNRMKYYGYTNTKVLEGGTLFNDLDDIME